MDRCLNFIIILLKKYGVCEVQYSSVMKCCFAIFDTVTSFLASASSGVRQAALEASA
jgi:hypothetical protein